MKITLEERKKYLKDNESRIREHCYLSAEEDYKDIVSSLKGKVRDEAFETLFPKTATINKNAEKIYKMFKDEILHEKIVGHKEEVAGVNIHSYLEKIRHNDYESLMCLIVKDEKIIKDITVKGALGHCDDDNAVTLEAIKEAKKVNGDIYIVHNHPLVLAAKPSGGIRKSKTFGESETGDYAQWHTLIPNMANEHNVKMLDFAVATEKDYFSLEQSGWKNKPRKTFLKQIKSAYSTQKN